jgi:hypothetical protein
MQERLEMRAIQGKVEMELLRAEQEVRERGLPEAQVIPELREIQAVRVQD